MFSSLGKRSSSTEEPTSSTAGWLGMGIVYTTLTANNILKKETVLSLKSYKYTAFHCSYFLRRFVNCYTVVSGFDIFLLFSFCFLSYTDSVPLINYFELGPFFSILKVKSILKREQPPIYMSCSLLKNKKNNKNFFHIPNCIYGLYERRCELDLTHR